LSERIQRVRRVGKIGSILPGRPTLEPLPATPRGPRVLDFDPPTVQEWTRMVGRDRARKAWKKLAELGEPATLPELLTYIWLEDRKWSFDFQSSLMGGRLITGGAVADFIIFDLFAGGAAVFRVQGEYWHQMRETRAKDQAQKQRLLQERAYGMPIVVVVDLWEMDIYNRSPEIFRKAEVGIGLRD